LQGTEFIYLLDFLNCTGTVSNNMLSGGSTRDFIGFKANGTSVALVNNTMNIGRGENLSVGVMLTGSAQMRIINNILHGPGDEGTAIELDSVGERLKILTNAFDGWQLLLKTPAITAKAVEEMNVADQAPASGEILGNISEQSEDTFASATDGVFSLKEDSSCVDAGFNLILLNIMVRNDYQGRTRVEPYDIGADEVY
jgi:hypothetical protein